MTITESDLREILSQESDDGLHRGVTVADVDRRVRRIKRRRLGALGGTVAAGLAAALAFTLPAGGAAPAPDDLWTGVMAQPSPVMPTVSRPVGDLMIGPDIAKQEYKKAGTREEFRVVTGRVPVSVQVMCSGPLRRLLVWIDGGAPQQQFCGRRSDGTVLAASWEDKTGKNAEHIVSAAVLPGELDPGMTFKELARSDKFFEGWERQLAEAKEFPLQWSVTVRELVYPVCRDNVHQVDPATGRVVVLRCTEDGKDHESRGTTG
ncbi:hypothetical protein [Streptosporangium minutum]|uniref:Uncharacterized protein n=1 Tax=Streptosporangium minutum TaxID=569862 RepID=A0A243RHA4_9ACTN|nr:hypothetical protein [Streptosporangium minutum]OUC94075.1 hypothetical protein CA984_23860 [Streptosporangium minutum]